VRIITTTLNTSVDRTMEIAKFSSGQTCAGPVIGRQPAGKGVNVSRCLLALGVPSTVTGFVGRRDLAYFTESFSAGLAQLTPVPGWTRQNTTILDPAGGEGTHIRELGPDVPPEAWETLKEQIRDLCGRGDAVVLAGSVPPGLAEGAVAELVQLIRERHGLAFVDTSGTELTQAVAAGPFLIKPNRDELDELLGRELGEIDSVVAAGRELLDRVEQVLVSLGPEGAVLVTPQGSWSARVAVDAPRHFVGCGDAFLAGFVAATAKEESPENCLRWAVACGAAKTLHPLAGKLDVTDVDRLRDEATVEVA